MLVKALCYETGLIEPAELARDKRRAGIEHHYLCTFKDCYVEVHPKKSSPAKGPGVHFYSAQPHGHKSLCEHYNEPRNGDGTGVPPPKNPETEEPLIPSVLGLIEQLPKRKWNGIPNPAEVALILAEARAAEIPGTLEQVVTAWETLAPEVRKTTTLRINNVWTNYNDAFVHISLMRDPIESSDWENRIIYGEYNFTPGKVNGYFFADSNELFTLDSKKVKVSLLIRPEMYADEKSYVAEVCARGSGNLFWHGPEPRPSKKGRWFDLQISGDGRYAGFALRDQT
ncbi:hypothetical protein [Nitrospirillum sp. BR 11163]|uniref:hypothetical protein n=1 Tax=Nitrospirillum sp. BR 11163 TaxID=3104323 RepID=UPI002AFE706E|nr:hypothetical protein [Nitrospirillum sp. BR 11163]MEA1674564.1 hypothetical protein [Nitrospirillum sp. BR 11163]